MKTNLIELDGLFQRKGKKLVKENLTLLISERQQTTEHRSRFFLISLRGNKKESYISSLYPQSDESHFALEYKGEEYLLSIDEETASISRKTALKRA